MIEKRYGGFLRRFLAFLVDMAILCFVSLFLLLIGLLALGLRDDTISLVPASSTNLTHGMGIFVLLYLIASFLTGATYFIWFHGISGKTPGKMLLGLRVIQASGDPMTLSIAFLRWVGYLISGPVFFLGFLWIAFDGRKQGWHDKIAATVVIRGRGEYNPDAYRNSTEFAPSISTATPAGALQMPPSSGEPKTLVMP
jgi:uncharacterized RDD family membrane protein YckC